MVRYEHIRGRKENVVMKHIRLEKLVTDETFNKLLTLYKEAKQTHDIDKILTFKSFVTRIVEAQYEMDDKGVKIWTNIDKYTNVICSERCWPKSVNSPLEYIVHMTNLATGNAFDYDRSKHLNRTL